VSFTVNERTREIGLRMALGAAAPRVRGLVVRQALVPVLVGALLGVGLVIPLGAVLESLLFQVRGSDPFTLGSVTLALVGVAALASFVPAWRASRVDPVDALRIE
jgi:ABC-type antimicrobial peptide transport system permease subunit